ncbi:hypothetical protein RvY_05078 [Ramazzottius varieornatus]|uniref:UBC core domain-containing protein n=1 Tax=Ramazzottius varieornatus TaxID=947166 RepID=A0A1D1UWX1_RAMVA|nr:hypothetical protein RvY_05078 [Ramazzottius varieornatus]
MAKPTFGSGPTAMLTLLSQQYRMLAEFGDLCRDPCDGFFLALAEEDATRWLGVMTVIDGMYAGGLFKFQLQHFLEARPRMFFSLPLFHQLVDPRSGEFNLDLLPTTWNATSHVRTLLRSVKEAFHDPAGVISNGPHSNASAALLCLNNEAEYRARVLNDISIHYQSMEEEEGKSDSSGVAFGPWIPELHEKVLKQMLETSERSKEAPASPEITLPPDRCSS